MEVGSHKKEALDITTSPGDSKFDIASKLIVPLLLWNLPIQSGYGVS